MEPVFQNRGKSQKLDRWMGQVLGDRSSLIVLGFPHTLPWEARSGNEMDFA